MPLEVGTHGVRIPARDVCALCAPAFDVQERSHTHQSRAFCEEVMFFLVMTRPLFSCSYDQASAADFDVCPVFFALSLAPASV